MSATWRDPGRPGIVYTFPILAETQFKEPNSMQLNSRQSVRAVIASLLVVFFLIPTDLVAQKHVVSPADLQKEVVAASQSRQQNLKTVQEFLSTPLAEKAMRQAKIDPQQVQSAVPTLNDDELAQLAARANKAQTDFAAGDIGQRELLWIILAVAVLVLIIIAVR
jgi:hypothetical protein